MTTLLISDTHGRHIYSDINDRKDLNMIIHCGDFTKSKRKGKEGLIDFLDWYCSLQIEHKIFIAGNHDSLFDLNFEEAITILKEKNKEFNTNVIYLQDSSVIINGVKFYGSPWSPTYHRWNFQKDESDLKDIWDKIPKDTNVLITHTPPHTILDKTLNNRTVGSKTLLRKIKELKSLKFHFFGHIHEAKGRIIEDNVTFINSSDDCLNKYHIEKVNIIDI